MIVAREQVQQHYGIPWEEKQKRPTPRRGRSFSRRYRIVFTGLVALAFITGVIISFYYAQVFITNYRIHSLQNQLAALQKETDDLYSDLAKLSSLERIEKVAINELGMVKPSSNQVIKVAVNVDLDKSPALRESRPGPLEKQKEQKVQPGVQEKNWVIQAFNDLVEQVKEGVPLH